MVSHRTGALYVLLIMMSLQPLYEREAAAQVVEQDRLVAVREAYRRLEFDRADSLARRALEERHRFSPAQLVELHIVVANVAYARGDEEAAARHFRLTLQLRPDLALDPLRYSPKVVEFFDNVRQEVAGREQLPSIVYQIVEPDPRPAAALRSALVPGWGQSYKGDDAKAWSMFGVWAGSTIASMHSRRRLATIRADLEQGPEVQLRAELEEAQDRWMRVRTYTTAVAAVTWIASYVDALLHVPDTSVSLHVSPQPDGGMVSFRMRL
jgi:hypothetical protein